jgi:quinol monooxygenase YgiN
VGGTLATNDTCCTVCPYFKVHPGKLAKFKSYCDRFIELTEKEAGVLFYGFSFDGDQAHCREGYGDAAALLAHLDNVGALLQELLAELAKLREPFAKLKPQYFVLEYGFRR